jgi:SAM-dependent methyltransferase
MESSSVDDFSEQWTKYTRHEGYFVSQALLDDVMEPFLKVRDLAGKDVAEIGCGNGRFVKILAQVARRVVAVEPCDGIANARELCKDDRNVAFVHSDVYALPPIEPLDCVLSIGVVHHTPDPLRTMKVIHGLLKEGGTALIWVYGKEGNELYLKTFGALRAVTQRLPHPVLHALSTALTPPLWAYIRASKHLPLPMRDYMQRVLGRFDVPTLTLTIYDQLNPKIAFYFTREEVEKLMRDAGFQDVRLHRRHGYSWTAVGVRRAASV